MNEEIKKEEVILDLEDSENAETEAQTEIQTEAQTEIQTEARTEVPAEEFKFTPEAFVGSLKYMGLGMLGIFVVIGVIIIVTSLLSKIKSNDAE